jgi:glutamate-1-semialdehyde 2,1-aminomutase
MISNQIVCIIQARVSSSRFPKKVLKKIKNKTILDILIQRVKKSKKISSIVIATSNKVEDDAIIKIAKKNNINFFRGSLNNVLKRYYDAAIFFNAKIIVRITSDCPFMDSKLLDLMIDKFLGNNYDYLSNTLKPTYPDGLDIEIFNLKALTKANQYAKNKYDLEHVTPYIKRSNYFKKFNFLSKVDTSDIRICLDEKEDFEVIKKIFSHFSYNFNVPFNKIISFLKKRIDIRNLNQKFGRDMGSKINKGLKMWTRAKNIIPGGNMLISKRPQLYAPDLWPTYFSKAKGINIWDVENKKFTDFSMMAIGTNILGYANDAVDKKVKDIITKSNISTLNAPEDILLAEKLIEMHPWAQQVKFAKTGGEINAVAIRIARSFSKKDNIAICGYHGWHDWYLSCNLANNKSLDKHLLEGLDASGVSSSLKNTCFAFDYNDIQGLKRLIKTKNIGIIFMEVRRNIEPKNNFLKKVRNIATKNNIVLIFDECTSGFRETFGGLHLKYKVNPDLAVFGKALGNGYPITAVIGKQEVMQSSEKCFISSTFWTERIGTTAALETLKIMKKRKTWKKISKLGIYVKSKWKKLAKKNQIKLKVYGLDAMPCYEILSNRWMYYKTFITQEFLKKKILATNTIYISELHSKKNLKVYFKYLDIIFKKINFFEKNRYITFLDTEVSQTNFKRLN